MIDLRPHFKHLHWRPTHWSFGVDVASDWADKPVDDPMFGLYKNCGVWTMDEAAILYECASQFRYKNWLDIGSHTGWTMAHAEAAGARVYGLDPMLRYQGFVDRLYENLQAKGRIPFMGYTYLTSREFFRTLHDESMRPAFPLQYSGIVIDGDHEPGEPQHDAKQAADHLTSDGVILLHDFIGPPVQQAVTWLMDQGFSARVYETVHMVAVCWRGNFTPPEHTVDPRIRAANMRARCAEFDWSRVK